MRIVAWFIRHGETDLNADEDSKERFRGDIDIPLNEEGRQQAQDLVPYFAARKFSHAFHSGMQRTAQTIEPLMESKGMVAKEVDGMNGLDTGEFAGKLKTKENKEKLQWYRDNPDEKIPGGESVTAFRERVDPRILTAVRMGVESGVPTITCCHGSVMREISRLFADDYNKTKVDPGGVIGIFKTSRGYTAKPILKESNREEDFNSGS